MFPVNQPRNVNSLYIHIPFCDHICHYCDFTKMLTNPKITRQYVETLLEELNLYSIDKVKTIFIGGGTPTALNLEELTLLLQAIQPMMVEGGEYTMECNFESTTEAKLSLMKAYGINRLSYGVQTFKPDALKALNRHHSIEDIVQGIALAKRVGFSSINIDLIYDLPKMKPEDLIDDLHAFVALDVDHISTYALTIHPHTVFGIQKVPQASDEVSRQHYEIIYNFLNKHGYTRYEVSNFSRHGQSSRHNLTYWRNQEYYGVGLGASGYLDSIRYTNTKSIKRYLLKTFRDQEEVIDETTKEFEYLMLNLRLQDGFSLEEFYTTFKRPFAEVYQNIVSTLIEKKLLVVTSDRVFLSFEGMMLLDYVVIKLGQHRLPNLAL